LILLLEVVVYSVEDSWIDAWLNEQYEAYWADDDVVHQEKVLREEWLDRRADALYEYAADEDYRGAWWDYEDEDL
jgi:hypothetical protein